MRNINTYLNKQESICVVGLGYVGLPLAVALARHFKVIGLDINVARVNDLRKHIDHTHEISAKRLKDSTLVLTTDSADVSHASLFIVTVPTPIDDSKNPDLTPVISATQSIAKIMKKDSTLVYESTVYPGVTEDICVPVLEKLSGLTWKKDFNVGYSPERINPGDTVHTVDKIMKVVSGDTPECLDLLCEVYGRVTSAGIHRASSIKVAEAAKVIENTQRDINIALMNELQIIFDKMGISIWEVLQAAGTKWNFLKFEPGLVGGHCIGVDPYYLTHKAEQLGYHPQVILAGRRINDGMGKYYAEKTIKALIHANKMVKGSRVLVLGFTFKENVPDIRNTRVIDIVNEVKDFGVAVDIYDPVANVADAKHEYAVEISNTINKKQRYEAIIVAVKHESIVKLINDERELMKLCIDPKNILVIDIKNARKDVI